MNRNTNPGGFRGLMMGGLMAASIGLAVSDQGSTYGASASDKSMRNIDTASQYGGSGTLGGSGSGAEAAGASAASRLPSNVAPGWKIRVCSEKTKASGINFKISSADKNAKTRGAGDSRDREAMSSDKTGTSAPQVPATGSAGPENMGEQTAMWSQGQPTMISLPSELRDADRIKLEASPAEKDKEASVCVLYDDHVAKKLKFDDRETSTIKKTESGECGC